MLGRGDGLEWLKALKSRDDCPKILFLTGAGNEIIAVRAMKAGADDYQRKQELTRDRMLASLSNGRPNTAMQGYAGRLSRDDMEAVVELAAGAGFALVMTPDGMALEVGGAVPPRTAKRTQVAVLHKHYLALSTTPSS